MPWIAKASGWRYIRKTNKSNQSSVDVIQIGYPRMQRQTQIVVWIDEMVLYSVEKQTRDSTLSRFPNASSSLTKRFSTFPEGDCGDQSPILSTCVVCHFCRTTRRIRLSCRWHAEVGHGQTLKWTKWVGSHWYAVHADGCRSDDLF